MKYALILTDGMADEPQEALGGKTPVQAARTPNMDRLAQKAEIMELFTILTVFQLAATWAICPLSDSIRRTIIPGDPPWKR